MPLGVADNAGDRRGLGEALLFDQQFQRTIAPPAGGHFEHAGFLAVGVEHGPDMKLWIRPRRAMDSASSSIETPAFTRLTFDWLEHQLVEGDVARGREGDLLNGSCHVSYLRDGRREPLSRPEPVTKRSAALFL